MKGFRTIAATTAMLLIMILAVTGLSASVASAMVENGIAVSCCGQEHRSEAGPATSCEVALCPCKLCTTMTTDVPLPFLRTDVLASQHSESPQQRCLPGFSPCIFRPPERA